MDISLIRKNRKRKDHSQQSGDDEATTAVLSRAAKHRQDWKEKQRQKSIGQIGFSHDQAYMKSIPAPRRSQRIQAATRGDPEFPQGGISKSVAQDSDAWVQRDAHALESERAYPLGTKECFNIQPGQFLIMIKGREGTRKTKQGDTEILVTNNVNGLKPTDKGILVGVSRTPNVTEGGGDGTGQLSTSHLAGVEKVIHQGWATIPVMADLVLAMTPHTIPNPDGGSAPIPAVQVTGQPQDMFVPSLHELDERVVSVEQVRVRDQLNNNKEFKKLFETKEAKLGGPVFAAQIKTCVGELRAEVATKLAGFEMFPHDCPAAAYLYWYGVERLLQASSMCAAGSGASLMETGLGALLVDKKYTEFFLTKEDKDFMKCSEGILASAEQRQIELDAQDVSGDRILYTKAGGMFEYVKLQLDGVTHSWMAMLRRMWVGKALNTANVGGPLAVLLRY
jgi:hypothetical protein